MSFSTKTRCSVILPVRLGLLITTQIMLNIVDCSMHKIRVGMRTVLKAYRNLSGHIEDSHQIAHIEKDISEFS